MGTLLRRALYVSGSNVDLELNFDALVELLIEEFVLVCCRDERMLALFTTNNGEEMPAP